MNARNLSLSGWAVVLHSYACAAAAQVAEPPAAPTDEPAPETEEEEPTEVVVQGSRTEAQILQESAEAVTVVDLRRAKQQTADLGEVLARTAGVSVRREGGLGSKSTVSLAGLDEEQIRVFIDGVPIERYGYKYFSDVPVNLLERIEIYRGVVPIRFGADALGGAVNLVTDQKHETTAGASYQVGSFGMLRTTVNGRYRHDRTGFVASGTAYLDSARNSFLMHERALPLPGGGTEYRDIPRFHDKYRAFGGTAEAGVVDQPWAKALLLKGFYTTFDKDSQHNLVMSFPYGEVTNSETTRGVLLRYLVPISESFDLDLVCSYSRLTTHFEDLSYYYYGWDGSKVRVVGRGGAQGELSDGARDEVYDTDAFYSRAVAKWTAAKGHELEASITPDFYSRIGDDQVPDRVDTLGTRDELLKVVGGLSYEANLLGDRLSNIAFGKLYYMLATHEFYIQYPTGPVLSERPRTRDNWGAGDGFRYRFTPWLLGKISYEYATRFPNRDELFGDGSLVIPNAELEPEISHNLNVGPRIDADTERAGKFVLDVNGLVRDTENMIILLAAEQFMPYQNLSDARTVGIEAAGAWTSPKGILNLNGSFTYNDSVNTAEGGPFAPFAGMRMPNRPYFFASWGARLTFRKVPFVFEPYYYGRFTEGFERGWSLGTPAYPLSVPAQMNHDVGITYSVFSPFGQLTCTFEVDNLTNEILYDTFGVQRPGRSFNLKLTAQL